MKITRRILAALICVAVALSLTACGDTRTICEVDGVSVPAGLYIFYQNEGYGDAAYTLYQEDSDYLYYYLYFAQLGYIEPTLFDMELEDGTKIEDHIYQYALDMCKQSVIVDRLFDELNLEFTPDEQAIIDSQINTAWNNGGSSWEENGVSKESYVKAAEASFKSDKVFDAYYEVGGLNGTTEEEIKDYFSDQYARIKYITFTFSDSVDDAIDEGRKNEQLELANSYLDMVNDGTPMDDVIEQYTDYLATIQKAETEAEEGSSDSETAETAETDETEESSDAEDTAEDVPYPNETIITKDSDFPSEKFVNYVFTSCNVGEATVVQDDTNFYLVERLDVTEREDVYDQNRELIMQDLFDSDYTKLLNDRLAKLDVKVNDNAVKRYTVKKTFASAFED